MVTSPGSHMGKLWVPVCKWPILDHHINYIETFMHVDARMQSSAGYVDSNIIVNRKATYTYKILGLCVALSTLMQIICGLL